MAKPTAKDEEEILASSELVSEHMLRFENHSASGMPIVLSVRSLSSQEGHISPRQTQLQPHHGEPSDLHAPLRFFN